jgi:hypothetical protein
MYSFFHILGLTLLAALPIGRSSGHEYLPVKEKTSWVVLKSSSLEITGHTNVNRFTCGVPQYTEADTLSFFAEGGRGPATAVLLSGTLRLDIDQFDCRSRVMTEEFKKTLQYGRYPQLKISFIDLEKMPGFTPQPETIKGRVEIEIAGVAKCFEIGYTASRSGRCSVELTGIRQLSFRDFALKPPRKMGGLIKVNDSLHVRFTLCLRPVE